MLASPAGAQAARARGGEGGRSPIKRRAVREDGVSKCACDADVRVWRAELGSKPAAAVSFTSRGGTPHRSQPHAGRSPRSRRAVLYEIEPSSPSLADPAARRSGDRRSARRLLNRPGAALFGAPPVTMLCHTAPTPRARWVGDMTHTHAHPVGVFCAQSCASAAPPRTCHTRTSLESMPATASAPRCSSEMLRLRMGSMM